MSPKYIIYISIFLLSGCGEGNNGYGWEYDYKYKDMRIRGESTLTKEEIYSVYESAVQCFGNKPPPFIIFDAGGGDQAQDGTSKNRGAAFDNPPLIVIYTPRYRMKETIKHETVHYFGIRDHNKIFDNGLDCIN